MVGSPGPTRPAHRTSGPDLEMPMVGRIALAACCVLPALAATGARAGEEEQAALCRGDVMRLCLSAVPDRARIVSCRAGR
jgi:hypothetical protein